MEYELTICHQFPPPQFAILLPLNFFSGSILLRSTWNGVDALEGPRAGGRAPHTLRPGGLTYAQGPHARCEKILVFKKIYSEYKMNKHVESLPKVDTSLLLFITVQ